MLLHIAKYIYKTAILVVIGAMNPLRSFKFFQSFLEMRAVRFYSDFLIRSEYGFMTISSDSNFSCVALDFEFRRVDIYIETGAEYFYIA